mmetsp:Transcript_13816/g.46066  ORF Transcript_13816/g.46066 Transcript_13816/m.46066 type:complete len:88 (+) Transcript_13816:57-320(+)
MDAISAFVRQSSQTNIPWGTRRSHLIGASALCYALPAVHDGLHANPRLILWLLQALACFWSDYVDSGPKQRPSCAALAAYSRLQGVC